MIIGSCSPSGWLNSTCVMQVLKCRNSMTAGRQQDRNESAMCLMLTCDAAATCKPHKPMQLPPRAIASLVMTPRHAYTCQALARLRQRLGHSQENAAATRRDRVVVATPRHASTCPALARSRQRLSHSQRHASAMTWSTQTGGETHLTCLALVVCGMQ